MIFPNSYFEDEVRDGFFVTGIMKKCWAAQLEVLSDISRVCKRYGIRWYADCGTLLGAVRHGGFIPWDDDLDICMFRDDYYKFLSVASRELTNIWPEYRILNYHDEEYWEPMSRIVNSDNVSFSSDRIEKFHGYPFCAGIDIFPLDFVCRDEGEEKARKELFKAIFELADSDYAETIDKSMLEELAKSVGKKYDDSKSAKLQLYEWGEIVSSLYRREEADNVCLMHFWYKNNDHIYPMELFEKTIEIPFETTYIQAPVGYDTVLKIEYGDYMKLVKSSGLHDYPHYDSQIEKVEEWLGESSPFHKSINRDSYKNICKHNVGENPRKAVRDNSKETIKLLYEAHEELVKLLNNSCINDAIELLSQCQEVAIQIGSYIEEYQGEGFITVKYLEDYCESVYQLSQVAMEEDNKDLVMDKIDIINRQLDDINDSIEKDISVRKEVVIIPFKADYWYVFDGIWKKHKDDPSVNVHVIPIPYYYKSALGEVTIKSYETDDYPDYICPESYNDYNFEMMCPDKIYIQYPYDNDNFITTIDPVFYAKNLKKYTNELVYIPYFKTDEIGQGEERAYKVMDNYVLTPAVLYSDKVMVQTDNIKELYIKKLSEFFGDETRTVWIDKLSETAEKLYERSKLLDKKDIDMPKEWKEILLKANGEIKKIIVYNISISGVFEHKNKMIDKIKSVMEVFAENSENIAVIWHHDPLIEATIPVTDPKLYDMFANLVYEFKSAGFGIYDDSENVERLLSLADAYYGDTDKLVQLFRNRNLPIMIQNTEILY